MERWQGAHMFLLGAVLGDIILRQKWTMLEFEEGVKDQILAFSCTLVQ